MPTRTVKRMTTPVEAAVRGRATKTMTISLGVRHSTRRNPHPALGAVAAVVRHCMHTHTIVRQVRGLLCRQGPAPFVVLKIVVCVNKRQLPGFSGRLFHRLVQALDHLVATREGSFRRGQGTGCSHSLPA